MQDLWVCSCEFINTLEVNPVIVVGANNCRAFTIVGGILWCVMESIGELSTLVSFNGGLQLEYHSRSYETQSHRQQFPTAGSFPHFATRFIDPALGFTLAISYGYCYTIAIASEVSAAAIIVVRDLVSISPTILSLTPFSPTGLISLLP
jgi:amino acid permease